VANPNDLWSWIMTDQAKTALAGAAGGIVRWVTLRERWQDGVASIAGHPELPDSYCFSCQCHGEKPVA